MTKGKEVQNWADPAMFRAQPQGVDGPQVQLLSCNNDPLGTIAATAKAYKGEFVKSLAEVTDDERRYYLADVRKNVLAAPLEFVHFHFRISGVTRAFTHQMVRQRTACYAQESMRFAVKEDMPVALPPSLYGTIPWAAWLVDCAYQLFPNGGRDGVEGEKLVQEYARKQATKQQLWRAIWDHATGTVENAYNDLINAGMPAEDARGLAPTNVLTQLNYTTSLRHLLDHAGLRLCTQAQFEWRLVWVQILAAIRQYGRVNNGIETTYALLNEGKFGGSETKSSAWQFNEIAALFKPICYKTGKCEFMSDGDRYCAIRERVQANHEEARPSSEWHKDFDDSYRSDGPQPYIAAIHDKEWLADPLAARAPK